MKISGSNIDFASQHASSSSQVKTEQLRAWVGNTRPDFEGRGQTLQVQTAAVQVDISSASRQAQAADPAGSTASDSTGDATVDMLKSMVEMLIGHKLKLISASSLLSQQGTGSGTAATSQAAPPQRAGFGIEYDAHQTVSESEQTAFQASGTIQTADGKSIAFNLDVQMSRSFTSQSDVSLRAGDGVRKDPLVINFSGNAAQLQDTRFAFDLTGDGQKANVALLGQGSAYVALDSNGNGKIDSGKELFGTGSGNGFADLKKYDVDGNGWIDDNDPIFSQLKAWSPDAKGGGSLTSLKSRGVGALYLGSEATPFELKNDANQSLGAVKASGVYVNENGSTGTLQQIDLNI